MCPASQPRPLSGSVFYTSPGASQKKRAVSYYFAPPLHCRPQRRCLTTKGRSSAALAAEWRSKIVRNSLFFCLKLPDHRTRCRRKSGMPQAGRGTQGDSSAHPPPPTVCNDPLDFTAILLYTIPILSVSKERCG